MTLRWLGGQDPSECHTSVREWIDDQSSIPKATHPPAKNVCSMFCALTLLQVLLGPASPALSSQFVYYLLFTHTEEFFTTSRDYNQGVTFTTITDSLKGSQKLTELIRSTFVPSPRPDRGQASEIPALCHLELDTHVQTGARGGIDLPNSYQERVNQVVHYLLHDKPVAMLFNVAMQVTESTFKVGLPHIRTSDFTRGREFTRGLWARLSALPAETT